MTEQKLKMSGRFGPLLLLVFLEMVQSKSQAADILDHTISFIILLLMVANSPSRSGANSTSLHHRVGCYEDKYIKHCEGLSYYRNGASAVSRRGDDPLSKGCYYLRCLLSPLYLFWVGGYASITIIAANAGSSTSPS